MLDKDFSAKGYSAILDYLRDNDYLNQKDIEVLLKDAMEQNAVVLTNISAEKAEIVRRALLENNRRRKSK